MKNIITIFLLLVSFIASAVVQDVTPGIYTPGHWTPTNYIKNPFCFANTNDISVVATGVKNRITTVPLDGYASCTIAGTSIGDKVKWATRTLDTSLNTQNCEARFTYAGDATKWKAYVEQAGVQASVNIVPAGYPSLPDTGSSGNGKTAYVYFPCGSNSNPTYLTFEATAAFPATNKISNVYIGPATGVGGVAQAQLIDAITISGCASPWSTTSTSFAAPAAQSGCTYTSAKGICTAPSTNIPGVKCSYLNSGEYRLEYEGLAYASVAGATAYYQFTDGTNNAREVSMFVGSGTSGASTISQSISYSSPQSNTTLSINMKTGASGGASLYGNSTSPGTIKVWYFPPASSVVQKTDQANYPRRSYTPTLTGFGSSPGPTNVECYEAREGEYNVIDCKFTTSSPTGVEARLSLPGSNVAQTFSQGIRMAQGMWCQNSVASSIVKCAPMLIESGASYLTFGNDMTYANATSPLAKMNGNVVAGSQVVHLWARVPIAGWTNSNMIVGTFQNIPSISGIAVPKIFGAQATTTSGAVANNKGGVINTCTAANPTVCSFLGLNNTPICSLGMGPDSGNNHAHIRAISNTSISVETVQASNGASAASLPVQINCFGD